MKIMKIIKIVSKFLSGGNLYVTIESNVLWKDDTDLFIYSLYNHYKDYWIIGGFVPFVPSFHASVYVFPGDPQTFMILAGP